MSEDESSNVVHTPMPTKCFFMHIGKAGGTYLGAALRMLARQAAIDIEFTSHQGRITNILRENPGGRVIFSVRHPLEIFVSGFYSRQRKGAPRYFAEWSEKEAEAFAIFNTANDLAESLSAQDPALKHAAVDAMLGIKHVRKNLRGYLHSANLLRKHRDRIHFIFNQAALDEDLKVIFSYYGLNLPDKLLNNQRLRHKNPANIDRHLSKLARKNLIEHYKPDLKIYRTCLALREPILEKFNGSAAAR